MVAGFGFAVVIADVTEQVEGVFEGGRRGRVVAGGVLHDAEDLDGVGLAVPVAELLEEGVGLLGGGGRGGVVAAGVLTRPPWSTGW